MLTEQNTGNFSDGDSYSSIYSESLVNVEDFWKSRAGILDWMQFPDIICNANFLSPVSIKWFEDGSLNAAANCIDRHLQAHAAQTAILWVGDAPGVSRRISYAELGTEVGRLANVLKSHGVGKGDTVTIYMPIIPEAAYAMLACARIGAVHSVVFAGFSASSLRDRIEDCGSKIVITADEGSRGGKPIACKRTVDAALKDCPTVETVLVARHMGADVEWRNGRDHWLDEESARVGADCPAEPMNAEDPLFILYTSGSTGKPKGVVHTTGGYLVYAALTHRLAFDYRAGEVYWCTADIGWVTGHSYVVYGPLANGATTVMYEGVPNWPDAGRCWDIVDEFAVSTFYTAPTAIRALMAEGNGILARSRRHTLRVLGSVGEPIAPEAWRWYAEQVGQGRCAVVDTWWQTETGGIMIAPLAGIIDPKPGSASLPFLGVQPVLIGADGKPVQGEGEGALCLAASWPGQARTLHGDHDRFVQTYFAPYPGYYFSGDGARRDKDGYYWITGRVDDVLNVSGHRIGATEIESVLVLHEHIAEAAVVGMPHPIKGEGIHAFVTPNRGVAGGEALKAELIALVRDRIGPIATPDVIQFASGLPKTRSGKIMRRILRKIASGDTAELGDTSTLADPSIVDELVAPR